MRFSWRVIIGLKKFQCVLPCKVGGKKNDFQKKIKIDFTIVDRVLSKPHDRKIVFFFFQLTSAVCKKIQSRIHVLAMLKQSKYQQPKDSAICSTVGFEIILCHLIEEEEKQIVDGNTSTLYIIAITQEVDEGVQIVSLP